MIAVGVTAKVALSGSSPAIIWVRKSEPTCRPWFGGIRTASGA